MALLVEKDIVYILGLVPKGALFDTKPSNSIKYVIPQ